MELASGEVVEHDLIHIRRSKFMWQSACHERIAIRNFSHEHQRMILELRFGADFADVFEVRGRHRARRGQRHPPEVTEDSVLLSYTGLDDVVRRTRLRFNPLPLRLDGGRAQFTLDLPPGARAVVNLEVSFDAPVGKRSPQETFMVGLRAARHALRQSASRAAAVATSNETFNETARRSVSDLYMLVTDTRHGAYPYAGIPWYSTMFGRDGLITALMMLWMDPTIARGVLLNLAAMQATRTDPVADAEPGKILHEMRQGEMARLGEVPFRRYYGTVDATPLFVVLAGAYLARTQDLATAAKLWPHVEAALRWIDERGDCDGDGFIEYHRMTEDGLANQGWKDSYDAVFHADGRLATGPIALVEVQGYVCDAKWEASRIARALGQDARADALQTQAAEMRERVEARFWSEKLGTYALALDGEKHPCLVRTSNAGHLLFSGVPSPERAARVAKQLLGSASFSGWGVRTVAVGESRYNPMSYHNGSVWPHDNALIGLGMGRYGLRTEAARILDGLFDAAVYIDLRRLPELLCGFPRQRAQGPTFYPVACAPQAWAAVAPLSLLQACLGISFNPEERAVNFDRPVLPAFTREITLMNLAIGDARLDVTLRGHGSDVSMRVLRRVGDIQATMRV
jgi:glycogen debranching enzyme